MNIWTNGQLQSVHNLQQEFGSNCSSGWLRPQYQKVDVAACASHATVIIQFCHENWFTLPHPTCTKHWNLPIKISCFCASWSFKAGIWLQWFSKNSRHTHQKPLKPSPVSERLAYLPQNRYAFRAAKFAVDRCWRWT